MREQFTLFTIEIDDNLLKWHMAESSEKWMHFFSPFYQLLLFTCVTAAF